MYVEVDNISLNSILFIGEYLLLIIIIYIRDILLCYDFNSSFLMMKESKNTLVVTLNLTLRITISVCDSCLVFG